MLALAIRLRQPVRISHRCAAGGREVAVLRRVRTLLVIEPRGQFGNQEIQVGPALAVGMAALVDRHVVDRGAQVGAVIEVETAQIELVSLAFAAMLADDQAGRRLKQFAGPVNGAHLQLLLADAAGVGGIGDTEFAGARTGHQHALQHFVVGLAGGMEQQRGERAWYRAESRHRVSEAGEPGARPGRSSFGRISMCQSYLCRGQ